MLAAGENHHARPGKTEQIIREESRKSIYKAPGFFVHWSYRGMGSSGCGKNGAAAARKGNVSESER